MKSGLKLSLAIALALGGAPAWALQLGEIRVKSALDEPLVAEIPIQLDDLSEAKDLRVGLATPADFAKAGLARAGVEHLRFSIVSDSTGHKLVLVTSDQPIGDPYLDFLIEVDSSKGRQLREYTVLLDPVIAAPPPEETAVHGAPVPQPAPVQPAPPPPVAQPPPPAPTARQPVAPAAAPPAVTPPVPLPTTASASAARPNEYVVQSGDTLYRIASETRPDDQVSVDQMMLALQNANPDAFYRPNINNLKSGAILRIPSRDEIASAPAGARARTQVHRQYEDWRGASARNATTVAGNETPAAPGAPAKSAAAEGDKLALVPPTQGGGSAATRPGEKGGTGTAEVAGLKQQLATAKESLASLKQENSELQSRVKDLEDISSKNQKLLGMKDAQIAELQNKLAQLQKNGATAAPAAGAPAPAGSPASAPPVAAASRGTAAPAESAVTSTARSAAPSAAASAPLAPVASTAPVTRPVTAKPVPAAPRKTAPAPQEEEAPWYQRPVTWVIAAIAIVALILLGLLRRRPRPLPNPVEEADEPSLADHFGESPLPPRADFAGAATQVTETPPASEEEHIGDMPAADAVPPPAQTSHVAEAEHDYDFAFEEPLPAGPLAERGMPAPEAPEIASPPRDFDEITREQAQFGDAGGEVAPAPEAAASGDEAVAAEQAVPEFSDDPVDTKLDLARAYLDMGDPAGARAMLEEVLNEGSQAQKDEARRLLESV